VTAVCPLDWKRTGDYYKYKGRTEPISGNRYLHDGEKAVESSMILASRAEVLLAQQLVLHDSSWNPGLGSAWCV
jgi:hypothetical protein